MRGTGACLPKAGLACAPSTEGMGLSFHATSRNTQARTDVNAIDLTRDLFHGAELVLPKLGFQSRNRSTAVDAGTDAPYRYWQNPRSRIYSLVQGV